MIINVHPRKWRGFTLIEVVIALGLMLALISTRFASW